LDVEEHPPFRIFNGEGETTKTSLDEV